MITPFYLTNTRTGDQSRGRIIRAKNALTRASASGSGGSSVSVADRLPGFLAVTMATSILACATVLRRLRAGR